jgi:16S rRNA (guanine527-N7)-methyltransferase
VTPLTPEELARTIDVSRETLARFQTYLELLGRWNARINLVAPGTLADPWRRHILDSAQIFRLLPAGTTSLVDLGSGAGLPGLILAIQGVADVHLVEADSRKSAFLAEAARMTGTRVTIHPKRIEKLPPITADAVTARALKPLQLLIPLTQRVVAPDTACYFHKGASWRSELAAAERLWQCRTIVHPSLADPTSVVLELKGPAVERA